MDHRLAGRYRKRYSEVLAGGLGQVDTGEGSVEVELQSPKVSGLTVVESGVRFGIAKAKLQLETRSVAVDYITGGHGLVRAEVDLPLVHRVRIRIPDGNLDEAFEGLRVSLEAKQTSLVHVEFNAAGRVKVGKVNLAVVPSGMAPLARGLFRCGIPQGGIVPHAADHVKALVQKRQNKGLLGKEGIRDKKLGYGLKPVLHGYQEFPIPVDQVEVHLLKGLGVGCLKGTESHAIVILNVNQAKAQQFEASLGTSGSSRPELSEPRSLVSRLGNEARVHRYGSELSRTHLVRKEEVEREPVKVIPGEGVPVGLFSELAIPAHLQEIDLIWYCHEEF